MINNSLYKLSEIPKYHPITQSLDRKIFWATQKRRCVEGYWVSGKWMPGPLYYYINFHHIEIEDDRASSRKLGLPWLRDIDWELFLHYEECRGFSGFADDPTYTCDRNYGPEKERALMLGKLTQEEIDSKTYVEAREYLRKIHLANMGKPLYNNNGKNFVSVQSRGGGKSYASSGIAGHNFTFDGAIDYDYWVESAREGDYLASDTIIGAIDTKYSAPLMQKVKVALDKYPGKVKLDRVYRSPLAKECTGSMAANKNYYSSTGSKLRHRTFRDNPFAANGPRANVVVLDEIGYFDGLIEAWASISGSTASESKTKQVIWSLGTGGMVKGKAALFAREVFEAPEEFNCITFEDLWENRSKPIGYFVPYTMTVTHFKKGPNNITDLALANKVTTVEREQLAKSKNLKKLYADIIYKPLKPSECFLSITGNLFPTAELQDLLATLTATDKFVNAEYIGILKYSNDADAFNGVKWQVSDKVRPIHKFPVPKGDESEGCLVIYQHPYAGDTGLPAWGRYLVTCDPYAQDTSNTVSLGSVLVYDRWTNKFVAEYSARPRTTKLFYEQVLMICKYYNSKVLYENQIKGLYDYFESKNALQYLAPQPDKIKDVSPTADVSRNYGMHMSAPLKDYGEQMIRDWLLEEVDDKGTLNLHGIRCIPLVRELIDYNDEINADRVIAMILMMYYLAELRQIEVKEKEEKVVKKFTSSGLFARGMGPNSYSATSNKLNGLLQ